MKLIKNVFLSFINLIALKDTWKDQNSGNKLVIETDRITLKHKNDSFISISKYLIDKDKENMLKIQWINMKESNLRIIDDKTIVLYDDINTQLYKRNSSFNNHIFVLYLFQLANMCAIAYTYYLLIMFINFILNNSNQI